VDRYGVPVFIGTYEDEQHIRGSARGIPEFHVFEALNFVGKFGGHKQLGAFSLSAEFGCLAIAPSTLPSASNRTPQAAPEMDAQANLNQIANFTIS